MTNERKTTPKQYNTMRPYSLTAESVNKMDVVQEVRENKASLNLKLNPVHAHTLYKMLEDYLHNGTDGLFTVNIKGALK